MGKIEWGLSSSVGWRSHMKVNFLIISYRGFGRSDGSPDYKGVRMDSQVFHSGSLCWLKFFTLRLHSTMFWDWTQSTRTRLSFTGTHSAVRLPSIWPMIIPARSRPWLWKILLSDWYVAHSYFFSLFLILLTSLVSHLAITSCPKWWNPYSQITGTTMINWVNCWSDHNLVLRSLTCCF